MHLDIYHLSQTPLKTGGVGGWIAAFKSMPTIWPVIFACHNEYTEIYIPLCLHGLFGRNPIPHNPNPARPVIGQSWLRCRYTTATTICSSTYHINRPNKKISYWMFRKWMNEWMFKGTKPILFLIESNLNRTLPQGSKTPYTIHPLVCSVKKISKSNLVQRLRKSPPGLSATRPSTDERSASMQQWPQGVPNRFYELTDL